MGAQMSIEAIKLARKYTQPGAIVPVDVDTTRLLVEALRAAIEQAERQEPVAWGIANTRPTEKNPLMTVMLDKPEPSHLVVPLYTAPPQHLLDEAKEQGRKEERALWEMSRLGQEIEQKPYCWTWDVWISGGNWEARYGWEPYGGGKRPAHSNNAKPLYEAPPQREWRWLTDEEIYEAVETSNSVLVIDMAHAIEAKLREKNGNL